jgi:hypothetical protein
VQRALERLTAHLTRMGATVVPIYLPDDGRGEKQGVDDYLLEHTPEELRHLAGSLPKAPVPVVELLDEPPMTLGRPLAILDGRAYAATWLYVKTTTTVTLDKEGKVVIFDPPRVETQRKLFVVRDDGMIFGPGGQSSLESLQAEDGIAWSDLDTDFVRDSQCWRAAAVKRYRAGQRPSAADVFRRLTEFYDHFMAFERSVSTPGRHVRAVGRPLVDDVVRGRLRRPCPTPGRTAIRQRQDEVGDHMVADGVPRGSGQRRLIVRGDPRPCGPRRDARRRRRGGAGRSEAV